MEYRIVPGTFCKFRLERKGWFFWVAVTGSDDANSLRSIVDECGGFIRKGGKKYG